MKNDTDQYFLIILEERRLEGESMFGLNIMHVYRVQYQNIIYHNVLKILQIITFYLITLNLLTFLIIHFSFLELPIIIFLGYQDVNLKLFSKQYI